MLKTKLLNLLLFAACTLSAQTRLTSMNHTMEFGKGANLFGPSKGKVMNKATARRYATNANRPGVVQIGLGWGSILGGASLTLRYTDTSLTQPGVGLTSNFGLRVQYGISEPVSLGFYARRDAGTFVTLSDDIGNFDLRGFSVGFEGKAYVINKDMFAVYIAPTIGTSFANSSIDTVGGTTPGKAVGFNFGVTAGLNWYWTDGFGMSCDLGYKSSSLTGIFMDPELADMDYKIRYGGFYIGVGLVVKFDTRMY